MAKTGSSVFPERRARMGEAIADKPRSDDGFLNDAEVAEVNQLKCKTCSVPAPRLGKCWRRRGGFFFPCLLTRRKGGQPTLGSHLFFSTEVSG
jgi:hypothetical protein